MENVFSPLNVIAESNSLSVPEFNLDSVTENEENYLATTLAFLTSVNEEYDNANRLFYRAVLESNGDPVLIQEASGSFFEKFKAVIRKFLTFIQSLFQRFITKLNAAVKNQKYLLKHKKDFDRFKSDDNFDVDGYNYTFTSGVPYIDLTIAYDANFTGIADFTASSYDDIIGTSAIGNAKKSLDTLNNSQQTGVSLTNSQMFEKAVKQLHSDLKKDLDDSYYDRFRAKVLGKSSSVSIADDDFAEECWKVYRDGETSTVKVEIDKDYISSALIRIEKYSDMVKQVEKLRTEIDKKYKKLEEKVDKMIRSNKVNDTDSAVRDIMVTGYNGSDVKFSTSSDALSELNSYIKTLTSVVQEMSNIHSIAFSSKLEALKGQYNQDRAALYTALSKCQSAAKIRAAKGYAEEAELVAEEYNEMEEAKLWII